MQPKALQKGACYFVPLIVNLTLLPFFKFRCDLEERTSWVTNPAQSRSTFKTEAFRYAPSGNTIYVKCIIRMCLVTDNSPECVRLVIMMIVVSVVLFRRRLLISLLVNLPRDWWLSEQQSSTFWRKVCVLLFLTLFIWVRMSFRINIYFDTFPERVGPGLFFSGSPRLNFFSGYPRLKQILF